MQINTSDIDQKAAFECLKQLTSAPTTTKMVEIAKMIFKTSLFPAPHLSHAVTLLTQKLKGEANFATFEKEIEGAMIAIQFLRLQPGFKQQAVTLQQQLNSVLGQTSSLVANLPQTDKQRVLNLYHNMQAIYEKYAIPPHFFESLTRYLVVKNDPKTIQLLETLVDEIRNCKAINRSVLMQDSGVYCTDRLAPNKNLTTLFGQLITQLGIDQMGEMRAKLEPKQWENIRFLMECCLHAAYLNNVQLITDFVDAALYPQLPLDELSTMVSQRVVGQREYLQNLDQEGLQERIELAQGLHVALEDLKDFMALSNEALLFKTEWEEREWTSSQPFTKGIMHIQYLGAGGEIQHAKAVLDLSTLQLDKKQTIEVFNFIGNLVNDSNGLSEFIFACMGPSKGEEIPRPLELKDIDFKNIPEGVQDYMNKLSLPESQKNECLRIAIEFTYNIVREVQLARNLAS